jgi:hypothetical protein
MFVPVFFRPVFPFWLPIFTEFITGRQFVISDLQFFGSRLLDPATFQFRPAGKLQSRETAFFQSFPQTPLRPSRPGLPGFAVSSPTCYSVATASASIRPTMLPNSRRAVFQLAAMWVNIAARFGIPGSSCTPC